MTPEERRAYNREYGRRRYALDPASYSARNSRSSAKRRAEAPHLYLYRTAKKRARNNHIEFTIDPEDIIIPAICPLLGIKMAANIGGSHMLPGSPSLDRKDPKLGYVKGNVWVISSKANTMKNNASFGELRVFALNLLQFTDNIPYTAGHVQTSAAPERPFSFPWTLAGAMQQQARMPWE